MIIEGQDVTWLGKNAKLLTVILAAVVICAVATLLILNDNDDNNFGDPERTVLISEVMTGGAIDETKFKALLQEADEVLTITVPYNTPGLDDLVVPNGVFISDSGKNIEKIIEIFIVDANGKIIYGWIVDGNNVYLGEEPVFKIAMSISTNGSNAPSAVKEATEKYVSDEGLKDTIFYIDISLSGELPYYSNIRCYIETQYAGHDFRILYYNETSTSITYNGQYVKISVDGYMDLPRSSGTSLVLIIDEKKV